MDDLRFEAENGPDAIDLERDALRHRYIARDVNAVAVSHHNLGSYLAQHANDHQQALAHHLAAALILTLAGNTQARRPLISAALDLVELPDGAAVPASVSDLAAAVGEVPGVQLDRLLAQFADDPAAIAQAFDAVLGQIRELTNPDTPLPRHFASWDPVIAGIIAARSGNDDARAAVDEHLTDRMNSPDWSRLAAVLRDILDAGPGVGVPANLGNIDTAITRRALTALTGDTVPAELWPAIPFAGLIARVVSAAYGDQTTAGQMAESLTRMDADAELAPLAGALHRILEGERAPALARGLDPVFATVVITILFHVPPAAQQ